MLYFIYALCLFVIVATIAFEVFIIVQEGEEMFSTTLLYYLCLSPVLGVFYVFSVIKLCQYMTDGPAQLVAALKPERTKMICQTALLLVSLCSFIACRVLYYIDFLNDAYLTIFIYMAVLPV